MHAVLLQHGDVHNVIIGKGEGSGEGMSEPYTIEEYFFSKRSHPARKHLHVSMEAMCNDIIEVHFI